MTKFYLGIAYHNLTRSGSARAGTGSKFLGIKSYRVTIFGPELKSGYSGCWKNLLEPTEPLKFFELFSSLVYPTDSRALSSLSKSSRGLAKNWAPVVSGIWLI